MGVENLRPQEAPRDPKTATVVFLGRSSSDNLLWAPRDPNPDALPSTLFTDGLVVARSAFAVPDRAFTHSPGDVLATAAAMLGEYEVDPAVISRDPLRGVLALALADELLATAEAAEREPLFDVLKVMSTGHDQGGNFTTLSGVVQKFNDAGLPGGTLFHPMWDGKGSARAYTYDEYAERFTDHELTAEARGTASGWGEGTELHVVRSNLGITPRTERPYELIVVNRDNYQVGREMTKGGNGIAFRIGSRIFLPSNYREFDSMEHEYAHTQSEGISFGHRFLLFSDFDEGLTESVTRNPTTYSATRSVINRLQAGQPGLKEDIIGAYKGDEAARTRAFGRVTDRFGLSGVLAIARLGPRSLYENMEHVAEKSVFLPADTVMAILERNDREAAGRVA